MTKMTAPLTETEAPSVLPKPSTSEDLPPESPYSERALSTELAIQDLIDSGEYDEYI